MPQQAQKFYPKPYMTACISIHNSVLSSSHCKCDGGW